MKKFRIWWDVGFGRTTEDVLADDQESALREAEQLAQEEATNNMDYGADECLGGNCGDEDDAGE